MSSLFTRSLLRLSAALLALGAARAAQAATVCNTLPKPVFLTGSGKVAIAELAKTLTPTGISLIYNLQGSCGAVDAIVSGTKLGTSMMASYNTAKYWDATGTEQPCDLMGDTADIGLSDVFASTCQSLPNGLPTNVGDFFGPVETYTFVVPKTSTQQSISKEAGYFVFGFGMDSGVAPWTDPTSIIIRDSTSGTLQMLGVALGVPAAKWKGVVATGSSDLVTKVSGSINPEATIGILTTEVAGANKGTISQLAYQDAGEACGYWPDSTSNASDKQNVRDGHYPLWGPLHLFTQIQNTYPVNPDAGDVIGYLTGTKPPPGSLDLVALLAQANIIPGCAMQVKRTSELGPLASFAPERSCSCYFDTITNSAKAKSCTSCMTDTQCPATAAHCNYGYCEAQ